MADTDQLRGMRNFFWGSLQRGDANDEYGLRLARAAAKSTHWNKTKGILVQYPPGINRFVADLLNKDKVFSEVAASFESENFELPVNGVEQVRVGTVADKVIQTGNDKLPFDCIVSFSVTKKGHRAE